MNDKGEFLPGFLYDEAAELVAAKGSDDLTIEIAVMLVVEAHKLNQSRKE